VSSWWGDHPDDWHDEHYGPPDPDSVDPVGAWECNTCTARNPEWTDRCAACGTTVEDAPPAITFVGQPPPRRQHP
jgi:hypothetical protein